MTSESSDLDLIEQIAAKDTLAIETLFARYHVPLYRFVLNLVKSAAIAEELTLDVFMEIWRSAGAFAGRPAPASWIYAIAYNRVLSLPKIRRDEARDDTQKSQGEDTVEGPDAGLQKAGDVAPLRRGLAGLSDEHRALVELVYEHQKSVNEVSEIVGLAESTVKARMFQARANLSKLLQEAGIDRRWP